MSPYNCFLSYAWMHLWHSQIYSRLSFSTNIIHSLLGPNGVSPPLPGVDYTFRFLGKTILTPLVQPYFYTARGWMFALILCGTKSRTCSSVLLCIRVKGHKDKSQTSVRRQLSMHFYKNLPSTIWTPSSNTQAGLHLLLLIIIPYKSFPVSTYFFPPWFSLLRLHFLYIFKAEFPSLAYIILATQWTPKQVWIRHWTYFLLLVSIHFRVHLFDSQW